MSTPLYRVRLAIVAAGALFTVLVVVAPAARAAPSQAAVPNLQWEDCGEDFQCATARVPRNYANPDGRKLKLAVVRLPAQNQSTRIGSLFVNFGGPGGPAVETIMAIGKEGFASLNDRFDIVGFDPRGVGQSEPAIDCRVNQETDGAYGQPFTTPENLNVPSLVRDDRRYIRRCLDRNPGILPFVSTANVARDMNLLRAAVGDKKLTYLGFSYGTFLGATYASLFPNRFRALALDGAVDADKWSNRPLELLREQTAGFERALGRFFQTCAAHQDVCQFGGDDPWAAFDELLERLEHESLPATGEHPQPVDADDARVAAALGLYAKQLWPLLAAALAQAEEGDGTLIRVIVDAFYGWQPGDTFDPASDRYFTITALEQRYPRDVQTFLAAGLHSWSLFDHFWWNSGYTELAWGLYPVEPRGVYYGPYGVRASAPTVLVVGTTYDPATPYRWARLLAADLGKARLLTMRGDGHTAYPGNSPCIDAAVEAYLENRTLPAPGTVCRQEVPFVMPEAAARARNLSVAAAERILRALRPRVRPTLVRAVG